MAKSAEQVHKRDLVNEKFSEHSVVRVLRHHITAADFNTDCNFFDYGLSSLQAISLHLELIALYPELGLHELFDRPTFSTLIEPFEHV